MPKYTNKSEQVFQDGDLVIGPGESVETEDQARIDQFEGLYRWQFEKSSGKAPSEAEVKAELKAGEVKELRDGDHVKVDEEGAQAEKVGKK